VTRLRTFLRFWYDFIVGDDWRVALAVVAALALTYALSAKGLPAWPVLPLTVAVLLPLSLWSRQTPGTRLRRSRRSSGEGG
jgi:hypothetical protein